MLPLLDHVDTQRDVLLVGESLWEETVAALVRVTTAPLALNLLRVVEPIVVLGHLDWSINGSRLVWGWRANETFYTLGEGGYAHCITQHQPKWAQDILCPTPTPPQPA